MAAFVLFLLSLAVASCGGGGDDGSDELARISTVAYVVTECSGDARGGTIRQRLQIRQGVVTTFQITSEPSAFLLRLPGTPENPGGLGAIQEVFVVDAHTSYSSPISAIRTRGARH